VTFIYTHLLFTKIKTSEIWKANTMSDGKLNRQTFAGTRH